MSFVVYRSLANYIVNKVVGHGAGETEVTESKRMVTNLMFAVVLFCIINSTYPHQTRVETLPEG
jgi:hypothetical protein